MDTKPKPRELATAKVYYDANSPKDIKIENKFVESEKSIGTVFCFPQNWEPSTHAGVFYEITEVDKDWIYATATGDREQ